MQPVPARRGPPEPEPERQGPARVLPEPEPVQRNRLPQRCQPGRQELPGLPEQGFQLVRAGQAEQEQDRYQPQEPPGRELPGHQALEWG